MRLVRHPDADTFLRDAREELERSEALHGLILGVAAGARSAPAGAAARYLATVRDGAGLALAALMTPPHPLVLAGDRAEAGGALDALAADLLAAGARPTAAVGPGALAEGFAECWARAAGTEARVAMRQRIHALTEVRPLPSVPGELRRAGEADRERVAGWLEAFDREALGLADPEQARALAGRRIAAGEVWLWEDGEPRSMAASARPTRHGVAVNAVYTPPEQRGRGYATACVAALSRRLLAGGRRFCVLYTDLANPTSNAIYARIGYRPVGDSTLVRFAA
ncbi:MAG TPA: GNAT family N-acetyltransferase [Longimicrobiaceae bacterium]|nr:GNAT family N-acetyltransferase [Longimicrobiaceae bacterium]